MWRPSLVKLISCEISSVNMCGVAGIDVALWDLLGKQLGVPVCKLLGGNFRDRVKVYATGCYYRHDHDDPATISVEESIKACAREAAEFRQAGFKAVKMKVGLLSVGEDLKRIAAAREAIGWNHCTGLIDLLLKIIRSKYQTDGGRQPRLQVEDRMFFVFTYENLQCPHCGQPGQADGEV